MILFKIHVYELHTYIPTYIFVYLFCMLFFVIFFFDLRGSQSWSVIVLKVSTVSKPHTRSCFLFQELCLCTHDLAVIRLDVVVLVVVVVSNPFAVV